MSKLRKMIWQGKRDKPQTSKVTWDNFWRQLHVRKTTKKANQGPGE